MQNMRQIILASQNYHSARLHFPMPMGGFTGYGGHKGIERISGLVSILNEIEEDTLWETVTAPSMFNGISYSCVPAPWTKGYPAWETEIGAFRCPTTQRRSRSKSPFGQTNYAFCIGDTARNIHNPSAVRGAFACGIKTRIADFKDGTSNTIAFAEIGTSNGRQTCSRFSTYQPGKFLETPSLGLSLVQSKSPNLYRSKVQLHSLSRGACWADGAAGYGLVNTILPPNRPSFAVNGSLAVDGIYTAGSFHPGGCIIAMADGSTRFIADTVDAGDSTQSVPDLDQLKQFGFDSPYGVWGAIGTANGSEVVLDID